MIRYNVLGTCVKILMIAAICMLFQTVALVNTDAASLQQINDFGDNPSNLKMFLYVPDDLPDHAPVLVGVHWCHGTARDYYSGNKYRSLSDTYKFIIIYPNANSNDSCFDVHSKETLTHEGGGDSKSVISMVRYVLSHYSTDSNRVFVTGHSSGGMLTNVMAGAYPDVFAAASASAGVPFGCFAGTNSWNSNCAEGKINHSPKEWGDLVRSAYPEYDGARPRIQIWHGSNDNTLNFNNYQEAIEQWTNVLGLSQTPSSTEQNTPMNTYVRRRYSDENGNVLVEAIEAKGEGHNCRIDEEEVVRFFGLDKPPTTRTGELKIRNNKMKTALYTINGIRHGISFDLFLSTSGNVCVEMFSLKGRKIAVLYDAYCNSGIVKGVWNMEQGNTGAPMYTGILTVSINGIRVSEKRLML